MFLRNFSPRKKSWQILYLALSAPPRVSGPENKPVFSFDRRKRRSYYVQYSSNSCISDLRSLAFFAAGILPRRVGLESELALENNLKNTFRSRLVLERFPSTCAFIASINRTTSAQDKIYVLISSIFLLKTSTNGFTKLSTKTACCSSMLALMATSKKPWFLKITPILSR